MYIQKQETAGAGTGAAGTGAQPGYWHYCREPEGYYPQVQECPDGWETVAPQTPDDNRK
jgi:coproporphyrinogen III oxidase-like Fe-S oxidoreductase